MLIRPLRFVVSKIVGFWIKKRVVSGHLKKVSFLQHRGPNSIETKGTIAMRPYLRSCFTYVSNDTDWIEEGSFMLHGTHAPEDTFSLFFSLMLKT